MGCKYLCVSCLLLASVTVVPCKHVQAPCVAQVCPGLGAYVGCNTQHSVDNLTARLFACIAQVCPGAYVGPGTRMPDTFPGLFDTI